MLHVAPSDLARMREQLLFDGAGAGAKLTRFWVLLTLAAVIAGAGIVTDSTATVIGAMIVAPLMTPILGTVLSIVTGDGPNLARSAGLVVAGAASVVAIAYVLGYMVPVDVVAETSSQVAGRVNPRLADLLAALATGVVGAFALVRPDVSDTLPGVAIAISLVPPLAVVGLTLEAGAGEQALGALLLFLTNVAAILLSGLAVMWLYRVRLVAGAESDRRLGHPATVALVVASVVAIAVPLAGSSSRIAVSATRSYEISRVAAAWAAPSSWRVDAVEPVRSGFVVRVAGPQPAPAPEALRAALDEAGLEGVGVELVLRPEERIQLDPSR